MGAKGTGLQLPVGDVHQIPLAKVTDVDRAKATRVLAARASTADELTTFLAMAGLDRLDATTARHLTRRTR